MTSLEVIELYTKLDNLGITIWIDGGWGIDALLGKQTRPHADLDIAIDRKDVIRLRNLLNEFKKKQKDDTSEWNFVLEDGQGHEIDVHVFEFDDKRKIIYGIEYPQESLTGIGTINGKTVNCIAAKYVIKFHENYEPKEKDLQDIKALCYKFNPAPPENYKRYPGFN